MPYFFFRKLKLMSQNLSSAAVVIDALRVNCKAILLTFNYVLRIIFFHVVLF